MKSLLFVLIILSTNPIKAIGMKSKSALKLIPMPDKVVITKGNFLLSNKTNVISYGDTLKNYFCLEINKFAGINLKPKNSSSSNNEIIIKIDTNLNKSNKELYTLTISGNKVVLAAPFEEGIFRGMQTIFQLIPASVKIKRNGEPVKISCCNIIDEPRFSWRGLNLDCARHFMTKDFIKRYIDILAYYKFNVLHLHLTDDQGWRIQIKKYPRLTSIGAWRKEANGTIYGGFYTQNDIKEIVAYAKSRFITVVPEIEMPGHCTAALAAYPEFSCTGGPFQVANTWGVFKDIYCPANDSTFIFLENILDEVIKLFPGKYIHIGGDEVPKDRWKESKSCQALIKKLGLKDEEGLQSYFIKRISKFLNSKGKQVIGWDEILQGGLAPNTIVESWQGMQGAIKAANLGHYVICSPAAYTYFNSSTEDLNLRVAYSFNPIPKDLPIDERKYILGGEASLWSEHAPQDRVDYQLFPRLLALSEVLWTDPKDKNYDAFHARVEKAYNDLTALGINYGPETKAISFTTSYNKAKKEFKVVIIPGQKVLTIRYTKNGKEPDSVSQVYKKPIIIDSTINLKIAAFHDDHFVGKKINLSFDFNKELNSRITILNKYDERYRAGGPDALVDGIRGTNNFHDGLWQGYDGENFEGIIDLGKVEKISKVIPRFMLDSNSWIFLPVKVEISLSKDSIHYFDEKTILNNVPQKNSEIILKDFKAEFKNQKARYIKVKAISIKKCPPWHPGAGQNAWLFIDEIEVE